MANTNAGVILDIGPDFERTRDCVIAAMCFPRSLAFREAYCLRKQWCTRLADQQQFNLSAAEIETLLNLPSCREASEAADAGVKQGSAAGDLLALIYEQSQTNNPEPSLRDALRRYRQWALGRKYGDGSALKYSDGQLRHFFGEASPSAHLWAAFRLLKNSADRSGYKDAFTRDGMQYFLGIAMELQEFAASFVPKRTRPAKPIIERQNMLQIPDSIQPIKLDFSPL